MKPTCSLNLISVLLGFVLVHLPGESLSQDATDLANRMGSTLEDGTSRTSLRLSIRSGSGKTSLNLQIKARRQPGKSDVLYQVLFPKEHKGESVLLSQRGNGVPTGFTYTPPAKTARSISKSNLSDPVFGSDLAIQDIIENFFRWKNHTIAGKEVIGRTECVILESKPGSGDTTLYGSVKSWIDPEKMVVMRAEKYDKAGKLIREIETTQVARDDKGRHIVAKLLVRRVGSGTETEFDGSNIRHDVDYADEDFTPAKMTTFR